MADKDARLRLNLSAAGMATMLQQLTKEAEELAKGIDEIGDESDQTKRKLHPMLDSANKGFGAAKSSALELGKSIKTVAGQVLTLGGALSLGGAVMESTRLVSKYHDIAFAIRTGTKEAQDWTQVQAHVEATADKWAQSNEEVANSYDQIFDRTRDLNFAKAASDEVAKVSAGTGKSVEMLTKLAGDLGDKFGITADDIGDAMASVVASGHIDELAQNMHEIGASARSMGLEGTDGLKKYLGVLESSRGMMKDIPTAVAAMRGLMDPLQNEDQRKTVEKKLGITLTDETGDVRKDAIEQILNATGGQVQEIATVFGGDTKNLLVEWGKLYEQGFDSISGTFQEKSQAGMDAFQKALLDAVPDTEQVKKDLLKSANEAASSPEENLRKAMQKVTNAFAQPEMVDSINKIAERLPEFADILSTFVDFAADHPLLAGAGVLGAKPAMAFGQSMAGDAVGALGKGALNKAKGTAAGKAMASAFEGATSGVGSKIAGAFAGSSKWATLGRSIGVLAAGAISFAITKALVDSRVDGNEKAQNDVITAGVGVKAAIVSGDRKKMLATKEALTEKRDQLKDRLGGPADFFDTAMLSVARVVTGDSKLKDGNMAALQSANMDLEKLERALARGSEKAGDEQKRSAEKVEYHFKRAADAIEKASTKGGGGAGTNGLPDYYTP